MSDEKGIDIHIGAPVWGGDFFDREEILAECWEIIKRSSVILSAPRRYGKSSVMLHLRDNPPGEFAPIYFELEDHFTVNDFIVELVSKIVENNKSILKKLKGFFSMPFRNVEEVSLWKFKITLRKTLDKSESWDEWKEKIKFLMCELLKNKKSKKLVFIFDEFPLMLHNFITKGEKGEADAVKLLQWLRKLRHESPFLEDVRFILGGSVGIEKVVSYLKATKTINDINSIAIGPFSNTAAETFIKRIFQVKGLSLDKKVVKAIMQEVGTLIPMYLQIMIDSIIKEAANSGREITPKLVRECYEKRVHGPEYKRYFEDFYERLWRYYPDDESKIAKRILRELANADDGVSYGNLYHLYNDAMGSKGDKEKFELLLSALESDFYIERNPVGDTVYFHNKWLKDWWRKYHGA